MAGRPNSRGSRLHFETDSPRSRRQSPAASDRFQPNCEQNSFGKRLGANFFFEDCKASKHDQGKDSSRDSPRDLAQFNRLEQDATSILGYKTDLHLEQEDKLNSFSLKSTSRTCLKKKQIQLPESINDDELSNVATQLKLIQETQDVILESLRHDIELIQTENVLLRQNNSRLQGEVSLLNQLVADLSFDLRKMRDIISSKQKLGVSLPLTTDRNANTRTLHPCETRIRNSDELQCPHCSMEKLSMATSSKKLNPSRYPKLNSVPRGVESKANGKVKDKRKDTKKVERSGKKSSRTRAKSEKARLKSKSPPSRCFGFFRKKGKGGREQSKDTEDDSDIQN